MELPWQSFAGTWVQSHTHSRDCWRLLGSPSSSAQRTSQSTEMGLVNQQQHLYLSDPNALLLSINAKCHQALSSSKLAARWWVHHCSTDCTASSFCMCWWMLPCSWSISIHLWINSDSLCWGAQRRGLVLNNTTVFTYSITEGDSESRGCKTQTRVLLVPLLQTLVGKSIHFFSTAPVQHMRKSPLDCLFPRKSI